MDKVPVMPGPLIDADTVIFIAIAMGQHKEMIIFSSFHFGKIS
jgi:hypothetical protein